MLQPLSGRGAAGWGPPPHLSQPAPYSDFLAGFLLFHVTTIIKTPATGENKLGQSIAN